MNDERQTCMFQHNAYRFWRVCNVRMHTHGWADRIGRKHCIGWRARIFLTITFYEYCAIVSDLHKHT